MMQDYLRYVIENFRRRKLRSWLTMTSIFIGIAAVVSLVSLGQGMGKFIDEQFEAFGADKIIIQPKTGFAPPGSDTTTAELTKDDEDIVERVRGISETTSFILENVKVEFNEQTRFHQIFSIFFVFYYPFQNIHFTIWFSFSILHIYFFIFSPSI